MCEKMNFQKAKRDELIDEIVKLRAKGLTAKEEIEKLSCELKQIIERLRGAGNGLTY